MELENLYQWGLTEEFLREAELYSNLTLARITAQHRGNYTVVNNGFSRAQVSGKFIDDVSSNGDFPAVGDWVMLSDFGGTAIIQNVLTRKSAFVRKASRKTSKEQVVASNIDMTLICMALNEDFNLRRLERYLSTVWASGSIPIVALTKSDLCENIEQKYADACSVSIGTDVVVCSGFIADGYAEVEKYMKPGKTIALIGSSGVGKSSMINHFIENDIQTTREVRNDGKGRHATTRRQMMLLPGGGLVIDTPGMRALGVISADVEKTFTDIETIAVHCRYRDCSHTMEPGCAVREAIEQGIVDAARFNNYRKIQVESVYSSLTARQIEEEKIKRLFGGKSAMKQAMRSIKKKK